MDENALRLTMLDHTTVIDEQNVRCDICNTVTMDFDQMLKHFKKKHAHNMR